MNRVVGIILVVASAAGFGTLALFGRYAYADGMDALTILCLRFALAAIPALALLAVRRERFPRGSVLLRLIGMGVLGYVGAAFAYLAALKYASAGLVALLLYLYPIFVALLAVLLLHEPLTGAKGLALGDDGDWTASPGYRQGMSGHCCDGGDHHPAPGGGLSIRAETDWTDECGDALYVRARSDGSAG